jgi:hypothetical protein
MPRAKGTSMTINIGTVERPPGYGLRWQAQRDTAFPTFVRCTPPYADALAFWSAAVLRRFGSLERPPVALHRKPVTPYARTPGKAPQQRTHSTTCGRCTLSFSNARPSVAAAFWTSVKKLLPNRAVRFAEKGV